MTFWIRYPVGMALFVVAVVWGWLNWVATRSPAQARRAVAGFMAGPLCRWVLLDVRVSGLEHLREVGGCVVVANHQGHVDEAVLANVYLHLDEPVILAKMTKIWRLPLFKRLFEMTGNVAVLSQSPVNAKAFFAARDALARGAQVGMYPEGTRNPDGRLGSFRPGAFLLAAQAQVPVVPIVVSRFAPEWDPPNRHLEPHVAEVRILEPVPTAGLTRKDAASLRDEVRARMKSVLDEDEQRDAARRHAPGTAAP